MYSLLTNLTLAQVCFLTQVGLGSSKNVLFMTQEASKRIAIVWEIEWPQHCKLLSFASVILVVSPYCL